MSLLKLREILTRWGTFLFVIFLSIVAVLVIVYIYGDQDLSKVNINDKAELLSWIYAGIMSLVAILTIFVTFSYEHKLIAATEILNSFYRPYTLSLEELRHGLIKYHSLTAKDRLLNYIYFILLLLSFLSFVFWGTIILIYSKFSILRLNGTLSVESIVDFGLYSFWFLMATIFILILFVINQSRNNKNPLTKGYLPIVNQLLDVDFISKQNIDISELLYKTCPIVELYSNPVENNLNSYELNIYFPIMMKNYRYVINIFNHNHEIIFKCYGTILDIFEVGMMHKESLDLLEDAFVSINENCYGEIKIYNQNLDALTRIRLTPEIKRDSVTFTPQRKVKISTHDNDKSILLQQESINIQYEKF
ncbi:hypothetical protein BAG01nite_30230 [Brevibacillus agri]|uniref:Uncharacterized protein n=1 Tax=Brevibacillus agri TaxID=51101 RepID=A0A3M8B2W9_9BACL|nr:hypothetical protein [Brevibacillus agri]QAV11850.1 hypothetical protein BA6348_03220 [Brevibacillus agri]RNB57794.1 hypothetical protein EB820_06595 [Brevibacillus agri]GED26921.1 hypothetical protein BAG01nite_30230 [Brevibacillus agri]